MALGYCQNFVSAQYLLNQSMKFDQMLHNYALTITRSGLGLLPINFRKFTTVMAHGYCQNFISAKYLENKSVEFDQILHMH